MLTRLPLKTNRNRLFTINYHYLDALRRELNSFVGHNSYMNSRLFSKKLMFTHELKANNNIEGINDDLAVIEKVISDAKEISDEEKRNRIINLYRGYKYILQGKEINEHTLNNLYNILSKDLLDEFCKTHMGRLYREAKVYILSHGRLDFSMDEGLPYKDIEKYMECYFNYINNGETFADDTGYFIKSQIMHFYLVYIHPYFDINGRTSRTTAMWYLLNHEIYPYIIFNRGINFDSSYDDTIKDCKHKYEITKFIKYMLITTKKELEKEYVIHQLSELSGRKWNSMDYQSLEYFITMGGQRSVLDYSTMYNRFNDKKRPRDIFENLIIPLIDDGTICVERESKNDIFPNQKNLILSLNRDRVAQIDKSEVTRINL